MRHIWKAVMKILMKKPAAGICCGVSHMSEALSGDESDHSRPDRIIGRPEEKQIAVYIEKITHSQDIREYQEAFRRLSGEAEKASGLRTQRAVLTVPAGFRSVTRNKLYEAAENAGIEILDILNEPTAAMIYYNAQELGRVPFEEDAAPEQEWLAGEAVSEETDFAHGCDSADVAAKSSSVTIKSKYKTSFWEETRPLRSKRQQ